MLVDEREFGLAQRVVPYDSMRRVWIGEKAVAFGGGQKGAAGYGPDYSPQAAVPALAYLIVRFVRRPQEMLDHLP